MSGKITACRSPNSPHLLFGFRPSALVGLNLASVLDKLFELEGDEEEMAATLESIREGVREQNHALYMRAFVQLPHSVMEVPVLMQREASGVAQASAPLAGEKKLLAHPVFTRSDSDQFDPHPTPGHSPPDGGTAPCTHTTLHPYFKPRS